VQSWQAVAVTVGLLCCSGSSSAAGDGRAESPAENARADEPLQSGSRSARAGLDALRTRLDLAAVELEIHLLALLRVLVC